MSFLTEARLTALGGILCLTAGLGGIGYYIGQRQVGVVLAARGVRTEGEVISRVRRTNDGESDDYYLRVRYGGPGGSRIQTFKTYRIDYSYHDVGDRIPVIYDPQDPSVARLGGTMDVRASAAPAGIGGMLLVVGVWLLVRFRKGLKEDEEDDSPAPDLEGALRLAKGKRDR